MRQPALVEELTRRPFLPFRMVLTDGTGFDVRHPELCMVGEHGTAIVGVPSVQPPVDCHNTAGITSST